MKKLFERMIKLFENKNRNDIHTICKYANGELGQYCENENIYIK